MSNIEKAQKYQEAVQMLRVLYPQLANVSDQEIVKAVAVARRMGLDILEEAHFIPFNNRVQIVISYETYLKRALKAKLVEWWKVEVGEDKIGGVYAEVVIKRRDWNEVFSWRVYLNEVKRDTKIWKEAPIMMLKKTAIGQAFRLCFPEILEVSEAVEEEPTEEEVITDKQRRYQ